MIGAFTGMRAGRSAARTGDAATVKASVVSEINEARILASLRKYLYSVRKAIFWNFRRLVLKRHNPHRFSGFDSPSPKEIRRIIQPFIAALLGYIEKKRRRCGRRFLAFWLGGA